MYVSRIEMTGFKSFADRTIVQLEPGVSAVVGPNGCGKTNICDAFRWVLGEENVRLLRGARIEDIIFAGTELRKPTGMAEVALTVSDVQDVLPVEHAEVTVTRRVFRSGESQFFINKVPCRLKDIVDLFLGTGMGRRAYSIMEREMVDLILDDNSGQRRKIIEEAAGISKYKARRKESINKMELTQRDLERVEDLISEVERRVNQLSRQAAKARRYERLTNRIKEVETYSSVKDFHSMKVRRDEVDRQLDQVETELTRLAKETAIAEADIENMKLEIIEVDKEINIHGQRVADTTDKVQEAESRKIVIQERRRAIDEKIVEITALKEQKTRLISERKTLLEAKRKEIEENSEKLEALRSGRVEAEKEYQRADSDLRSRRAESVESARQQMANMKRTIDAASAVSEMRSRKTHLSEILEKSDGRYRGLSKRIDEAQQEIDLVRAEAEKLKATDSSLAEKAGELSRVISELTEKMDSIREERARLGEEAARASSRHEMLRELVERYEGYESGVKALMKSGTVEQGVHGVVGDIVKCTDSRYEPAVVAALSDAIQYVVVDGREHAAGSIQKLKEDNKGPATLVMLDSIPMRMEPDEGVRQPDGVIGRVMDFVECKPRYRELFDYLLHDVYVVENLEDAFELSRPSSNGHCSYVTPDGDAVFRGSIVRSGSKGPESGVYIGRRDKVEDLAGEAAALEELAEEQEKAFQEIKAGLDELHRQKESNDNDLGHTRAALNEREKILESRTAERDSLQSSMADIGKDMEGFRNALDAIEKQLGDASSESHLLDVSQREIFEDTEDGSSLEKRVEALQKQLEHANHEILRIESNGGFLDTTVERVSKEIEDLESELKGSDDGVGDLTAKRVTLTRDEEELMGEVKELLTVLGGFEDERKKTLDKKHGIEAEIEERRERIKTAAAGREQALAGKQELTSEVEILGVKSDSLRERMLEEYEVDIAEVDPEGLQPSENCEEELSTLKGHLRTLGPVNLVALDEYDVEKERYEFLKAQRDDLLKARTSLDEAILQINKRARAEFMETFTQVQKDFRRNFEILFQGGASDLRLRYEHDPLESPIDILAQPTGKKLEHISLLSGGERALTAIAFLFGVYYTKPSPFCLLDEVDAPLDDANVLRFVNLIKDLSDQTQFLMVTHNKKTMEAATCLYGVTMEDPGVSRMVSVRMKGAPEEELEPSAAG